MEISHDEKESIAKLVKPLEEKFATFTSIFEKFGLDIITKLGQTTLSIKILTDKIDDLNKATLDIKSLIPKLTNVIENQKSLESELDLIKFLIQKLNISLPSSTNENDLSEGDKIITDKKSVLIEQLINLKNSLEHVQNSKDTIIALKEMREKIFELTGGHKLLYDISQFMNELNDSQIINTELKNKIKEKIEFWINNL